MASIHTPSATPSDALSSSCLCGAVSLTVLRRPDHLDACHCGMCRTWGGGPAIGFSCEEVAISEPQAVAVYDSSDWAQRAFCRHCGTHLYYRLKGKEVYFLTAGFFPELTDVPFTEEIFIDAKPPYYSFANDTGKLTGEEVFQRYAALMNS